MRNLRPTWIAVGFALVSLFVAGGDRFGSVVHLAVFVVVVAVAGGMWWRERMLSGPLRRIADANGWTYSRESQVVANRWRGDPFPEGEEYKASSVIRGRVADRPFTAFNYTVERSSGRDEGTTYYSVVALDMPVQLPVLDVRATLGGVEQAIGLSRIEFEHEGFNRRYRVTTKADAKYASDLLSARTIEALIAGRIVNLRIGGGRAVAWAVGRLEVHEVLGWSRALVSAVDLIPDFVWKDHAPRSAGPPGLTWPPAPTSLGSLPFPAQE